MRNNEEWQPFLEMRGSSEAWGVRTKSDGKVIIPATNRLDGQDADLIARAHNWRLKPDEKIWIHPIVSHRTMMPVYQFSFGDLTWELGLREMRAYMDDLYQALESGIADAFIARWVRSRLAPDAPPDEQGRFIAAMMSEFRTFREELINPVIDAGSDDTAAAS